MPPRKPQPYDLHEAISTGKREKALRLLRQGGINVNAANENGDTPLHIAAYNGNREVVELLLAQDGINVNAAGEDGDTPLHIAVRIDVYGEMVQLLLEKDGINVNAANEDGNAPLHCAARNAALLLLQQDSINVNAANKEGDTPLHSAAYNGDEGEVELLLEQDGINANAANNEGDTPLHKAAYDGLREVVELLLAQDGINVNAANEDGDTPLHHAAGKGHREVVELLLAQDGINVNAANEDGDTLLHIAAGKRNVNRKVVELLLQQDGIDANPANQDGDTPLLSVTLKFRKADAVRLLLENGAQVNAKNNQGKTFLHKVASGPDSGPWQNRLVDEQQVLEILIGTAGFDPNLVDSDGETPMNVAAERGKLNFIRKLVEGGVTIEALDGNKILPLLYSAAAGGNLDLIYFLVKEKPDAVVFLKDVVGMEGNTDGGEQKKRRVN